MRTLLFLFLIFSSNIGYSQSDYQRDIIGSWTLLSERYTNPLICLPNEEPTKNNTLILIFYKFNDLIIYSRKQDQESITEGTWEINDDNHLIIKSKEIIIEMKIRFSNSKLFLHNTDVVFEFEKK